MRPIFDAHLDLAWNAMYFDRDLTRPLSAVREQEQHMTDVSWRGRATVSLPELRRSNVACCVATILARSGLKQEKQDAFRRMDLEYATKEAAFGHAQGQLAYYLLLEAMGHIRILRTVLDLNDHWSQWQEDRIDTPIGIILSMEGCDPIYSPDSAEQWFIGGLRAAGLTHYGVGRYAFGSGTDGPLGSAGRKLLSVFEQVGIILDVTHLGDRCMADVLGSYGGPILASHHNCRALVPGQRQLTDLQIRRLINRGAIIGTAMDAWMLYPGWERDVSSNEVVSIEAVAYHIDHVCQIAGNANHAAIGSDLDGGFGNNQTPHDLQSIYDVQKLDTILKTRGYLDHEIDAIFFKNWLRFFLSSLPTNNPNI